MTALHPARLAIAAVLAASLISSPSPAEAVVSNTDIVGPAGSGTFGRWVEVLPNGNFVVVDPLFDSATAANIGAVYLYNGATGALISTVTGSTAEDRLGDDMSFLPDNPIRVVGSSDFVIRSPFWDNGGIANAGAATWIDGTSGLDGVISPANSLVGSTAWDQVALYRVAVLTNGNYVVTTNGWDNGASADAGAATWGNGSTGVTGVITPQNSIVGTLGDYVGYVVPLTNGNYVVGSPNWHNGSATFAGAVTWGNGATGTSGVVSASNSLVGNENDQVGGSQIVPLTNGNYVVPALGWDNGSQTNAGAVTWGDGVSGTTVGPITAANSLVGSTQDDVIGYGIVALANGNYVTNSQFWSNGASSQAGAVTWGNGTTGTVGVVGPANSLVGVQPFDYIGAHGVTPLTNGNYVVSSVNWKNAGVANAGAATWGNGSGGTVGPITAANSLVGTVANDIVGRAQPLANGNYVIASGFVDVNGVVDAGAVTWGNGATGTFGAVGAANSIHGSTTSDSVGGGGVTPLTNGHYAIVSLAWDNGPNVDVGAVTWADGTHPSAGAVTTANSLYGSTTNDAVGTGGLVALATGNYVVASPGWDRGAVTDAGAVTWGSGTAVSIGPVSASNSLVGSSAGDNVGSAFGYVFGLGNGDYTVATPGWDRDGVVNAGAFTVGDGAVGSAGPVSVANSIVGSSANDSVGASLLVRLPDGAVVATTFSWDNGTVANAGAATFARRGDASGPITGSNSVRGLAPSGEFVVGKLYTTAGAVVVGRPVENIVTLMTPPDVTPPVFASPPPDVSAAAPPGASATVVTFPTPAATEDRGAATVGCSPASGSSFGVGTTTVTCTATNLAGLTATTTFTVTVTNAADYVALAPARLVDSRPGQSTVDGIDAGGGSREPGSTLEVVVTGRGGVSSDAVAVTLNVTVVDAGANGFVTVFPCGSPRPTASNVNYAAGATVPNAVLAKVGVGGTVCIFTSQAVHLVVDVNGFFPITTSYVPVNPARVLETRPGEVTIDGLQQGGGRVAADSVTALQIVGRAGMPVGATSVALNVTITDATGPGFVTVFPCGTSRPTASNLNYVAGSTVANLVVAKIGAGGNVCIYTQAAAHLLADINGYFPAVTSFVGLDPARLLETRPGLGTIDGLHAGAGAQPAGTVSAVGVAGRGGVPTGATTVVLTVTVTDPAIAGFATVYPCGIDPPLASNLNFAVGQTVANSVIVKIGAGGAVCIFNSQETNIIADVAGAF